MVMNWKTFLQAIGSPDMVSSKDTSLNKSVYVVFIFPMIHFIFNHTSSSCSHIRSIKCVVKFCIIALIHVVVVVEWIAIFSEHHYAFKILRLQYFIYILKYVLYDLPLNWKTGNASIFHTIDCLAMWCEIRMLELMEYIFNLIFFFVSLRSYYCHFSFCHKCTQNE